MKVEIENKAELIEDSVDVAQYKKERLVYLVFLLVAEAAVVALSVAGQGLGLMPVAVLIALAFLGMMVYFRFKIRNITMDPERYDFYEVKLIDPDERGKNVCFSAEFELANGEIMRAETNPICATSGNMRPHYSRFENRKVLAAYDEELGQLIVVEVL